MIMASSTLTASLSPAPTMDHQDMDAVSALLGVSPSRTNGLLRGSTWTSSSTVPEPTSHGFSFAPARIVSLDEPSSSPYMTASGSHDSGRSPESVTLQTRPRSNSAGLDALALLASKEQAKYENTKLQKEEQPSSFESFILSASPSSSSDDDDSESMPPPAPRGRRRSASNPEGMEKWDSLSVGRNQHRNNSCRRHFMLPDYVLAEELAEASAAIEAHGRKPPRTIPEHAEYEEDPADNFSISQDEEIEENLTPAELLRRARSRLLEDLSEGNISGDKGVVTLPHSLPKYKEFYNNGRIGIYTPNERAAVIDRYKDKRCRRVWNKKIRYGCRKNLADRRLRVKGRFVKRCEQEQLAKLLKLQAEEQESNVALSEDDVATNGDEDMPDVNDPEAGFDPTDDQPYRRVRRHTIT